MIDRPEAIPSVAVEIREARPVEFEETGAVTALAYREFVEPGDADWEEYLEHIADVPARAPNTTILIAVENGRILGSATLELGERIDDDDPPLAPGEAHIRMLGVHPDARGRGVARALMDACFEAARAADKTLMTLHTTHRMKIARSMYERMGFERTADRVFPDGFVLLSYRKPVPPA